MAQRTNEAVWSEKYQRWTIKVQRGGERKSFYSSKEGRKGKLEAERKADQWISEGEQNDTMRFNELASLYLASIDTGNGTAHKKKQESIINNWLLPIWEHKKVSALTNRDYQNAVNAPAERKPPLSKRTCEHVRAAITALYSYAVSDRITMEAPAKIKIPKAATVGKRHILQPDDIARLFDPQYNDFFYIHAYRFILIMGLRRGELCGLTEADINGDVMTINRSLNSLQEETAGKNENARRSMVLPKVAQQTLTDQKNMLKQRGIISQYIFPTIDGEQTNSNALYDSWATFREVNNFPKVSLHELRHTMISIMKSHLPATLLKQFVGHSEDMDTFGIYGHEVDGEARISANAINEEFIKLLKLG